MVVTEVEIDAAAITVTSADADAGLRQQVTLTLHPSGVLSVTAQVTNIADSAHQLDGLTMCVPLQTGSIDP